MRHSPLLWVLLALLLPCLTFKSACTPGRDDLNDPLGQQDGGDTKRPPPACVKGSLRCSTDGRQTENCDGKRWQVKQVCDALHGDTCLGGKCLAPCERLTDGNVGCSFYPVNLWSTSTDGELGIVASNTSDQVSAEVTLSDAGGMIDKQTAMPGGLVVFRLPHTKNKLNQTEQAQKAFHLESSAPVAVYQFHPIDAARVFSGSATLLLPEHVMAKSYFVMAYTYNAEIMTTPPQGQGLLAVIALQDNTDVEITVPVETQPGGGVPGIVAGGTLKRTLNRLEVLEVAQSRSMEDISGAFVKASANVVVFGGAGGVTIPRTAPGGNHLGVQMFPLATWGKRYVASKFKQRNLTDHDYYRIVASVDNTHVEFKGSSGKLPPMQTLMRGTFYEFDTDSDFEIVADQPVLALQYMPAWGNLSGTYDPADFPDGAPQDCPFLPTSVQCLGDANVAPLIPVEQYRSDYLFYVPDTYKYNYINVSAPLDATLLVDGVPVQDILRPIGDSMLGRVIVRLKTGNHRITGTKPFGLMGYGYAYATSYSYAGGLNLQRINPVD